MGTALGRKEALADLSLLKVMTSLPDPSTRLKLKKISIKAPIIKIPTPPSEGIKKPMTNYLFFDSGRGAEQKPRETGNCGRRRSARAGDH